MKINLANIKKAKKLLIKSECIGIPTETVYGLAGNAYSNVACKKIFKLKKRPKINPLIVHYYNHKDLIEISNCNDLKKLHLKYGNKKAAESGKFKIFNLKENIKKEVIFLRINQHTQPIFTNDGFVVLMVCDRYLPEINFQNEETLRNEIESKLFIQLSDRYMNRLKRSSYIEKNN